jgi:hypothetical protein
MKTSIASLVFLCLGTLHSKGLAAVITFQPAPRPGGGVILSQWVEQGYRFVTPQGVASNDMNDTGYPYNGTTYLQVLTNQTPLTIARVDSMPFNITSIDLAEYSTVFTSPKTVTFTGNKAGGGTVNTTFVTDGIIDGNGPLVDFQTFTFPSTFSNLSSVTTTTATFSFDNVNVTIVPEPSGVAFLFAGVLMLITRRRLTPMQVSTRNPTSPNCRSSTGCLQ